MVVTRDDVATFLATAKGALSPEVIADHLGISANRIRPSLAELRRSHRC